MRKRKITTEGAEVPQRERRRSKRRSKSKRKRDL
jgi:hypothetical protein